ncbi:MAG: L,D-transpeptidase family protein [Acidobacteriota bacterium]|nr:L,D-transpeptidase family protein [Acidobacteriota bacterium]
MRSKIILIIVLAISAAVFLAYANWHAQPLPAGVIANKVLVEKGERRLTLYYDEQVLKTYRFVLGGQPIGHKFQEGDSKTPEGKYVVDRRNPHSRFHLALHLSYPNEADVARAKRAGVSPGGDIMIHGIRNGFGWIGRLHRVTDWTEGCIAVTDSEIEEIWRAVPDKTEITIEP